MASRTGIESTDHEEPDRIPLDLGATDATFIMAHPYRLFRAWKASRRMDKSKEILLSFNH
jgi:hypothetical protein